MGVSVVNGGIVFEGDGARLVAGRQRWDLRPRKGIPRAPFHWSSDGWADAQITADLRAAALSGGDGPILAALPAHERAWLAALPDWLAAAVLDGVRKWAGG